MKKRDGIAFERGGGTGKLLVLIHGLGATGGVWSRFVEAAPQEWVSGWLALDLPGHGSSARLPAYGIGDYAHAVAGLVATEAQQNSVVILGHSLGGAVALMLGGPEYGIAVDAIFGLGIKTDWSSDDLARLAILSHRTPRMFETRDEALAQHARACGLGDIGLDSPLLDRGVVEDAGKWRLAMDGRAFAISPPPMASLTEQARCPTFLSRGQVDAMVSETSVRHFDRGAVSIPSAGHNAMVDNPDGVWTWMMSHRPTMEGTA